MSRQKTSSPCSRLYRKMGATDPAGASRMNVAASISIAFWGVTWGLAVVPTGRAVIPSLARYLAPNVFALLGFAFFSSLITRHLSLLFIFLPDFADSRYGEVCHGSRWNRAVVRWSPWAIGPASHYVIWPLSAWVICFPRCFGLRTSDFGLSRSSPLTRPL
jgi:hypothetical protein